MQRPNLLKVVVAGALLGLIFSGFSTQDFAEHLDRQEHSVHCSFVPGFAAQDATGSSACQVAMMSPYSSVFRQGLWGGIPIALPSMSVFAFLMFLGLVIAMTRPADRRWLGFLVLSTALPVVTSVVMAVISIVTLGTLCKLCIGIYVASFIAFGAALLAWRQSGDRFAALANEDRPSGDDDRTGSPPGRGPAWMVAVGILFVAAPVAAWVAATPDVDELIADCGLLDYPRDLYGVMVNIGPSGAPANAIEVLDPLCPACRAFDDRLIAAGLDQKISRQLLLVPLDSTCNWMVDSPIHAGACTVSEAVLCAKERAPEVLAWAFDRQEEIREASTEDPRAARHMVVERFPELRSCVGSSRARSQINKSLRWAVRNRLPLFTPQLFIEGVKLCNEDIDLGLDYAVDNLVARHTAGTLPKLTRRPFAENPVEAASPTDDEVDDSATPFDEPGDATPTEAVDDEADTAPDDLPFEGDESTDDGSVDDPAVEPDPIEPDPIEEADANPAEEVKL